MPTDEHHKKKITGAASIIGSATVLSRIAGFVRDAAIAYIFGAGMYADAFFMAFRIANLLRRLVGEGALTSSFIPIFTEELHLRTQEGARELLSKIFTLLFIVLIVLSALGMIFSREIVYIMSPGFAADPVKFDITVKLTRIMFPYMIFVGLMAIAMGALNSVKHFGAPAISPVFFNLTIIAAIFSLVPLFSTPVYALGAAVLAGGFIQCAIQFPYLKKFAMMPHPNFSFKDPAIRKILLLMGPAAFGVGIYQLNIFVTLWFSSQLPEGAVSYLYYAGRLMEVPLGIFGVAIATAALPSLSEHAAKHEWDQFRSSLSFALRIVNFVCIPATIGLFVLSYPIIDVLFRRGEFGTTATAGTAVALYYYALGLVPISVARILSSVFYSLKDTATPVYAAIAAFFVNAVLCYALIKPLGHGGLALATSISAAINAAILLIILKKKFGRFDGRQILASASKSGAAAVIMGAIIYLLVSFAGDMGRVALAASIAIGCGGGIIIYIILAKFFGTPEVVFLKDIFRRQAKKRPY
ncbi:MAG: murein biosynthesis integral membrane protein MurJ [Deltaproteobacteria bacterium]|nr:murein biosynthesis integral membrane protein MurJ [Deltaproteobacteria bacterium]